MQREFVISGVGGQGILVASQLLGHSALLEGKRSMYFSMFNGAQRGGVCECLVVVSEDRIEASPVIEQPLDANLSMHPNSFLRFESQVEPGGLLVYNTSLKHGSSDTTTTAGEGFGMSIDAEIELEPKRDDITYFGLPATDLAIDELGNVMQATLIAFGAFLEISRVVSLESAKTSLTEALPAHRQHLVPINQEALEFGAQWARDHASSLLNADKLRLVGAPAAV